MDQLCTFSSILYVSLLGIAIAPGLWCDTQQENTHLWMLSTDILLMPMSAAICWTVTNWSSFSIVAVVFTMIKEETAAGGPLHYLGWFVTFGKHPRHLPAAIHALTQLATLSSAVYYSWKTVSDPFHTYMASPPWSQNLKAWVCTCERCCKHSYPPSMVAAMLSYANMLPTIHTPPLRCTPRCLRHVFPHHILLPSRQATCTMATWHHFCQSYSAVHQLTIDRSIVLLSLHRTHLSINS